MYVVGKEPEKKAAFLIKKEKDDVRKEQRAMDFIIFIN
jgi:phosphatidylinositol kinase/protein kinase (PI-3  family)